VSSRITLNYGLRWDYFGVIGAKNNAFSIFDVKTGHWKQWEPPGAPASLYPKDWTNFAPRLSVADDLLGNGKLVIRAGGGIFYDGPSQDFFVGNQAYNTNAGEAGPAFNGIGFASPVVSTITAGVPDLRRLRAEQRLHRRPETGNAAVRLLQPQHRVAARQEDRARDRLRRLAGPPPLPLPRHQPVQQRRRAA
jgi:hypothetical protein